MTHRTIPAEGFMCKTDWDDEIGYASDGNSVYPSVDALKRARKCTNECGIVKVRVEFVEVVQTEDWSAFK